MLFMNILYLSIYISTPRVLLPNSIGQFNMKVYRFQDSNKLHDWKACVLYSNVIEDNMPLRIHDQCITSEVFGSLRCDCNEQLQKSMNLIKNNGMIIYLPNEGRGIGLYNKILTYKLQECDYDTFESCDVLNLPYENRDYNIIPTILNDFKIKSVNLITNNNYKIKKLERSNIKINKIINLNSTINKYNKKYIETKYKKN